MSMTIDSHLLPITREQAPHLYAALEDLCKRGGIEHVPTLHSVNPSSGLPQMLQEMLGHTVMVTPLKDGKPGIVLGDKGRGVFGHADLGGHVSDPMKAVLAHELGHVKHNDFRLIKLGGYLPLAGAAAAMAGLYLANRVMKKHPEPTDKSDAAQEDHKKKLHDSIQSEIKDAKEKEPWSAGLLTVAKYTAVAAVGLAAGIYARKSLHSFIEYRADKFSAQLMGSGKPLAEALTKFEEYGKSLIPPGQSKPFAAKMIEWLLHPPLEKRISVLNGI